MLYNVVDASYFCHGNINLFAKTSTIMLQNRKNNYKCITQGKRENISLYSLLYQKHIQHS